MANFFKEYQKELREKREKEERKEPNFINGLERGQKVKYSILVYTGTEIPANIQTLYFAAKIDDTTVLLNENKKEATQGKGFIYDACGILEG